MKTGLKMGAALVAAMATVGSAEVQPIKDHHEDKNSVYANSQDPCIASGLAALSKMGMPNMKYVFTTASGRDRFVPKTGNYPEFAETRCDTKSGHASVAMARLASGSKLER